MKVETILSSANPLIKELKRASARGAAALDGYALLDTPHLLEEALRSGLEIGMVLFEERQRELVDHHAAQLKGARLILLPASLLEKIASTGSPQGVVALARLREAAWQDLLREPPLLVVLDSVQDPGNAGALARAAEAFGATGIVFLQGSARATHPRTLRAAAGSLFRLPFRDAVTLSDLRQALGGRVALRAAGARGGCPPHTVDWRQPCALVIGSEGGGVRPELAAVAETVTVPARHVESLNAAVAGAILLYEAARQRSVG